MIKPSGIGYELELYACYVPLTITIPICNLESEEWRKLTYLQFEAGSAGV